MRPNENSETLLQSSATSHLFQYPKMVIATIPVHNVFDIHKLWIKDKAWIILQKCPDQSTRQKILDIFMYIQCY